MKHKQFISVFSVLYLFISIPLTVFAIKAAQIPTEKKGGYYHTLVDRVDVSADYTEFTFVQPKNAADACELKFLLTVKKCEPDLYARLDDVELMNLTYESATFLCTTRGQETALPQGVLLPVENGASVPLTWEVTINGRFNARGDYSASLRIHYTSGLTMESADSRILDVPLTIHIL